MKGQKKCGDHHKVIPAFIYDLVESKAKITSFRPQASQERLAPSQGCQQYHNQW